MYVAPGAKAGRGLDGTALRGETGIRQEKSPVITERVKPIETRYAGYRFRSRLEAKWAVALDAAKFEWKYEPEGFETPAGRYLPDFLVKTRWNEPDINAGTQTSGEYTWLEIKPEDHTLSLQELQRYVHVAQHTRFQLAVTFDLDLHGLIVTPSLQGLKALAILPGVPIVVRKNGIFPNPATREVVLRAARSARFEHGESGA